MYASGHPSFEDQSKRLASLARLSLYPSQMSKKNSPVGVSLGLHGQGMGGRASASPTFGRGPGKSPSNRPLSAGGMGGERRATVVRRLSNSPQGGVRGQVAPLRRHVYQEEPPRQPPARNNSGGSSSKGTSGTTSATSSDASRGQGQFPTAILAHIADSMQLLTKVKEEISNTIRSNTMSLEDKVLHVDALIARLSKYVEDRMNRQDAVQGYLASLLEGLVHFSNGVVGQRPLGLEHLPPMIMIDYYQSPREDSNLSNPPNPPEDTFADRLAVVADTAELSLTWAQNIADFYFSKSPPPKTVEQLAREFGSCTYLQLQSMLDFLVRETPQADLSMDNNVPSIFPVYNSEGVLSEGAARLAPAPQNLLVGGAPDSDRVPKRPKPIAPAKFGGDKDTDISDFIFTAESYLSQSGFAREDWSACAMGLLEKQALSTYIAFAQPLGRAISWDEFKNCLSTAYARPDREIAARKSLFNSEVRQVSSVADYLRRFRQVIARCGTAPDSQSLGDLFWNNLKPHIRDKCRIDPKTGRFWTSFEAMAEHTVLFDSQNYEPSSNNLSRFRGNKNAALKAVAAPFPSKQNVEARKTSRGGNSYGGGGPSRVKGKGGGNYEGHGGHRDKKRRGPPGLEPPHNGCDGFKGRYGTCTARWDRNHYADHTPGCDYAPGGRKHKPYNGN